MTYFVFAAVAFFSDRSVDHALGKAQSRVDDFYEYPPYIFVLNL